MEPEYYNEMFTPTKRLSAGMSMSTNGHYLDHGHGQPNVEIDDEDDDYDDYVDYQSLHLRKMKDNHNKCCNNAVWCVRDICGVFCVLLTWFLILYAEFVVMRIILLPSSYPLYRNINAFIWQIMALLAFTSHLRTMLTDPGAVPRGNATKEMIQQMGFREGQVIYKCQKCCSIKPERAHHCSVCQRCIRKMDHHCPWVNNCVGENNQKFFVLFTFYIAMISIHALVLAINHFIICIQHDWKECSAYTPPATVVFLIFLIFEALLFTIFTMIMLCTQLNAIWNDETVRLK
ncbi:unnamed protein product [Allacma fusca]|uniref:Palmitoyltransferase n=1 Tax=Allacma fusca TaxID=39272 RepID=A0A8J2NRW7_9HEXA|nr:unnamed protein product [Allacma fusca]